MLWMLTGTEGVLKGISSTCPAQGMLPISGIAEMTHPVSRAHCQICQAVQCHGEAAVALECTSSSSSGCHNVSLHQSPGCVPAVMGSSARAVP